jgi:nitrite reductase/ring-hydroxylating ferredoxin subunit
MSDPGHIYLCAFDDLGDPGSKGVTVSCNSRLFDLFVVRKNSEVRAYMNSCPHTGGPLDWVPDQFLSIDREYIQCATHAALFRWQDGACISGPCAGDRLTGVPVILVDGQVLLSRKEFCRGRAPGDA